MTISISVQVGDEWQRIDVEGEPVVSVPGLAVTRAHGETANLFGRWIITHMATGLGIPFVFRDRVTAIGATRAIGPLADWTLTDPLRGDVELRQSVRDVVVPLGGACQRCGGACVRCRA